MDNLIFSLNITVPIFSVMAIGYILRKIGIIRNGFVESANSLNFKLALPMLVFQDIYMANIKEVFDLKFVLFCSGTTTICFISIWVIARIFMKDKQMIGAFVHGSYRGSAAVLGSVIIINMYGHTGMAPLMIISTVPLYNIYAVIVLSVESGDRLNRSFSETLKKIVTNPIILGIMAGIILNILDFHIPYIMAGIVGDFAGLAAPLALITIGASFSGKKAIAKIKPAIIASCIKLVIQPLIFLPIAMALGFTGDKLMSIIIMLAAPTTASAYIMAKNMNHDAELTSSIIVLTTILSAFTITACVYIEHIYGFL